MPGEFRQLTDALDPALEAFLLDTVVSTAPVGLALVDRDLRFVRVNETFAAFNDRPVDELVGHPVAELPGEHGLAPETLVSSCRNVLSTGEAALDRELTWEAPTPEGGPRHGHASFTPVTQADASVSGVIVVVVDVTERRALLEAERDARMRADFLARAGAILDASLVAGIADPEHLDLVRQLGPRSVIIAALKARGRLFGTLSLASAESGRTFEQADLQLAEELAARAGMAIDNARLYTERSRIAHTLQVKLLPERLPDIAGTSMAARYRAAGELNEVGGGFYDVFQRSATEWALVVGDVSGKGAEAAAVTALARYTLRAAALEQGPPSGALRRLNTALLYDDTSQFATVVMAYLSAATGTGLDVRLALAGHPAPAVLRRDGSVEMAGRFGTMAGIRAD